MRLRDPEASPADTGGRRRRRRQALGRRRLRPFLRGISLLSAFVGAGLISLLVGGLPEQHDTVETLVSPSLADEPPSWLARGGDELLEGALALPAIAGPSSSPEVAPDFDPEALEDRLREIAEGRTGTYGVAVLEPESGTRISLQGDEEFVAASIGKLPPMATLYRAAARGELDLEDEISIEYEDIQSYGSGSLHVYPEGHTLSLRDTAYYLVNHSDNTAWVMLDRYLGEEKIEAELRDMGIEDSRYYGHGSGYYTTPDDVLLLLEKISDPSFTTEELSEEMLDAMTETVFEDRIPEKLPADVRVAHKIGSYEYNFGDAGVVFYKDRQGAERRYYLVVLSKGAGEYEARDVMQEMSLAVYEALTGTTVDPEWSRGGETRLESDEEAPVEASTPTPPPASVPDPTEKAGEGSAEKAGSTAKPLPEEKSSSKAGKQSPATRYDSFYPSPKYGSYYDWKPQDWEDYNYYEALPEEAPYWKE